MKSPIRTFANSPTPPQDLLDFVQLEVPYKYQGKLSVFVRRKLVTAVRLLWTFLKRPPHFADLHDRTFREFGEHLIAEKSARETCNDNLRYAWEVASIAHRLGYLAVEPAYIQWSGAAFVPKPKVTRRPAQYADGGGWDTDDLLQLFAILGNAKGNIGSVPCAMWWTVLVLFIMDSGAVLRECLALKWIDVELDQGTVQLGPKKVRLRDGTTAALEALKLFGQPNVFPPPSSATTAFQLVYRWLKRMLVEGGLQRRTSYPLDKLGKVKPSDAMLEQLAGLVVIRPPATPSEVPPMRPGRPGRISKGWRVYHPPESVEIRPEVHLSETMTVTEFFDLWLRPVILDTKEVTVTTTQKYTGSLAWWELITGNAPLGSVDDNLWAKFEAGLRSARFKRGELCEELPLSPVTQAGHKRTIRTILQRAAQKQLCRLPTMIIRSPRSDKKAAFTVEAARKMIAYLCTASPPASETPPGPGRRKNPVYPLRMPPQWWKAILSGMFYTGLRISEVMSLRWGMLVERADGLYLDVPSDAVPKTGKAINIGVHDCLKEALAEIGPWDSDELIFSWPGHLTYFASCHGRLQKEAGIAPILSPHAFRRTHATELGKTFLTQAIAAAQAGLNHASSRTTEDHYLSDELRAMAVRSLPRLW